MKKRLLQIGSFLMALVVLFVSVGWDVKFHYCTEDHQLTGSFGTVADHCLHCLDHEHGLEAYPMQQEPIHFDAKCCCESFESIIQFTDNYVFSLEKQLIISLQSFVLPHLDLNEILVQVRQIFDNHSPKKALKFLSGQERILFFSSLKLNPLVF